MTFITTWPSNENQLAYDDSSSPDFDPDYQIIPCEDYSWESVQDFIKESKPGDFIFILGEDDFEGLIFRHK